MGKANEGVREADRYSVKILGNITLLDRRRGVKETCLCNTVNMSLSGALIETGWTIPKGALLTYSFYMPGVAEPVKITGEVVRVMGRTPHAARQGLNQYGIAFLDVAHKDRVAMLGYLAGSRQKDRR